MAGRVRFRISQAIVVAGWYISSFLLLGAIAAAPSKLPLPATEARTFSQAYYYACFAAVLYFILATMILMTIIGVHVGHYAREYKLTMAQRMLMFQTVAFLGYLLAAAAVYMKIESWEYLDAVYWCTVTLFTIGFGDYVSVFCLVELIAWLTLLLGSKNAPRAESLLPNGSWWYTVCWSHCRISQVIGLGRWLEKGFPPKYGKGSSCSHEEL